MREHKKNLFDSDLYVRISNFKKISIVDSLIFMTLPAKPSTFTVMANSLRIVEQVMKKNFFN